MYIVSQNGSKIVTFNPVSVYYIENTIDFDKPILMREEPYLIAADNGQRKHILGFYSDSQKADEALQALLCALQNGEDTFYMPQP